MYPGGISDNELDGNLMPAGLVALGVILAAVITLMTKAADRAEDVYLEQLAALPVPEHHTGDTVSDGMS